MLSWKNKDVLYQYPDEEIGDEIGIVLATFDKEYSWLFDTSRESTYLKRINEIGDSEGFEILHSFQDNFQYISAARSDLYETDDYNVEVQKQLSKNEGRGELVAQFLYHYGKTLKVNENLFHELEKDPFLISQVTAWEREISNGVSVNPKPVGKRFEIRYSFSNDKFGSTDEFSSKNVGFGLSYSLPVIVAVLS